MSRLYKNSAGMSLVRSSYAAGDSFFSQVVLGCQGSSASNVEFQFFGRGGEGALSETYSQYLFQFLSALLNL